MQVPPKYQFHRFRSMLVFLQCNVIISNSVIVWLIFNFTLITHHMACNQKSHTILIKCAVWHAEPHVWCFLQWQAWNSLIFCMLIQIQIKVDQKMFGCGQSGHRTLKLTLSQEWMDAVSWFFAWWYKFRKAKIYFTVIE